MSSALVVGAAGTAFSIYSGISSGNQAKRERADAQAAMARNAAIADQVKKQEQPAIDAQQTLLGQLQSQNLTPQAQMAQDQLKEQMRATQAGITANAPMTGEGVAGGRALTTSFNQAQGIAGINLQDQVNKRSGILATSQALKETPGWARLATGANADQASSADAWAQRDAGASASAYGNAFEGLRNLAKLYQPKPEQAAVAPTGVNAPGGLQPNPGAVSGTDEDAARRWGNPQPQQV
jgi:hypothetical protein